MQTIDGMILKYGEDEYELIHEFSLTDQEEQCILGILKNHGTEGGSICGTKEDIITSVSDYLSSKKEYGRLLPMENSYMTVRELKELLSRADDDATVVVASGYRSFYISGASVTDGAPALESEQLEDYLDKYSME